ncbi:lipopolysaccharide biosynthesis protein [Krasilnikovia sp. M28-CT-15]|uniref:lipopolysaccharide biosynthesis protein n=1 Tax=Krasilnikovia sp. M28-CT-15 TaxID=3373540 RepID=UPI003876D4AC
MSAATWRGRLGAVRRSRVTAIAGSIVGTSVVTSALGFVFWTVAARSLPAATVGQLGSATAASLLLGEFGILGCGTLLISHLGTASPVRQRRLLVTAVAVSTGATGLLAAAFGVGAWLLIPSFAFLAPARATFWWLLAAAALTALGGVLDQAMLVLGRPVNQVIRNAVASGLKVLLLAAALLAGYSGVDWPLAGWVVGQVAACLLAARAAWRLTRTTHRVTVGEVRGTLRRYWPEAARHHGMNVALAAPSVLQPVIVAAVVTAESNALFTTVRLVSTFAFMAPYALAMGLFAASADDPQAGRQRARVVFRMSLALSLALYGVLFVTAPLILTVFGHDYAAGGVTYLRIIALGCPLLVFKDQYIARMRAARTLGPVMPYVLTATALEIAGTLAGAMVADLTGALAGWLLALGLGALWVSWQDRAADRPTPPLPGPPPRQPTTAGSSR